MDAPNDLQQVTSAISLWHQYDPGVKADLFSTAIATDSGLYLVDPIPLIAPALNGLISTRPLTGMVVTNANHVRASLDFAGRFRVPILARAGVFPEKPAGSLYKEIENGTKIGGGLEAIAIDGAAAGEIALYSPEEGGSIVIGDALIHFDPYGFTTLPRKYCANEKQMRHSLRQLLDREASRLFFAHGMPVLANVNARLSRLLDGDKSGS